MMVVVVVVVAAVAVVAVVVVLLLLLVVMVVVVAVVAVVVVVAVVAVGARKIFVCGIVSILSEGGWWRAQRRNGEHQQSQKSNRWRLRGEIALHTLSVA